MRVSEAVPVAVEVIDAVPVAEGVRLRVALGVRLCVTLRVRICDAVWLWVRLGDSVIEAVLLCVSLRDWDCVCDAELDVLAVADPLLVSDWEAEPLALPLWVLVDDAVALSEGLWD